MSFAQDDHSGRDPKPMRPPKRYLKFGYCHWVQRIDYDGRPQGLEVYQWQASAQKWCRPNEYSSGRDIDLIHYEWVALCPTPPFKHEVQDVQAILAKLRVSVESGDSHHRISRADFEKVALMFAENIVPRGV